MLNQRPAAGQPPMQLLPFCFWTPCPAAPTEIAGARPTPQAGSRLDPPPPCAAHADPALLRGAISAHLEARGWPAAEPLRWAITAVHPSHGWQLEGVAVISGPGAPSTDQVREPA